MKTFAEIILYIKKIKGFADDAEVATLLGIKPKTLATAKGRNSIPFEALASFCSREGISFDLLLTGEGSAEEIAKYGALYNNVRGDPELEEILEILQNDLPEAKKAVLKILKTRKSLKEGLKELFEIDKPLKEEG
jgi:hypothetical protein